MEAVLRVYAPETDFEEVFAFARDMLSEPPYDDARDELLTYPRREMVGVVALDEGGAIIGFCAATHPYWNAVAIIDYIVVAPGVRRQGVGRQLITAVVDALRDAGTRIVTVQTASWNKDGIRFYEREGFVVRAQLPEYFGAGNDMVWLDQRLP